MYPRPGLRLVLGDQPDLGVLLLGELEVEGPELGLELGDLPGALFLAFAGEDELQSRFVLIRG